MTTLSPPTTPLAYTLAEGLRKPSAASTILGGADEEWSREELLLRKLGPKGWGRVHQFRNYYESGWGEKGRVLSPRALDAFFRFLEDASFPADRSCPSVFLTDSGGIELCWENRDGKSIQVEFTGTAAEFYKAATDEEGAVAFDCLAQLSRRLSC
jgi:hypothetical protein